MSALPGSLADLTTPQHRVVAELLHGCSKDPATRTMAATTLVLTLCQAACGGMTPQPPSVVLVNAGGTGRDPLDALADRLASGLGRPEPVKGGTGKMVGATPEQASRTMLRAVRKGESLGTPTRFNEAQVVQQMQLYQDARATAYGTGSTSAYTAAWHEEMGLITDESDMALLRFDTDEDRAAFRHDVLEAPDRLLSPVGPGAMLRPTSKRIAISGSLTPELADAELVEGVLALGLPVFFLPHIAESPLTLSNPLALSVLSNALSSTRMTPIGAATHLPSNDWWSGQQQALRKRLVLLPDPFDTAVQRTIRELLGVCCRIAVSAAPAGTKEEEVVALISDLHVMAYRGIAIGIAGLAWHGLGFDPGCTREIALKLLGELRDTRSMTRREVQRHLRLPTSRERDTVVERLATEGLIREEGRFITAIFFREFVESLHARPEFPMPEAFWPRVVGEESS